MNALDAGSIQKKNVLFLKLNVAWRDHQLWME